MEKNGCQLVKSTLPIVQAFVWFIEYCLLGKMNFFVCSHSNLASCFIFGYEHQFAFFLPYINNKLGKMPGPGKIKSKLRNLSYFSAAQKIVNILFNFV